MYLSCADHHYISIRIFDMKERELVKIKNWGTNIIANLPDKVISPLDVLRMDIEKRVRGRYYSLFLPDGPESRVRPV
jgi:hypothetical protein